MTKILRRTIAVLTLLCTFLCSYTPVQAEENEEEETVLIEARFFAATVQQSRTFEVPFNRNWFKQSATEYNNNLMKVSLAMATTAFRPKTTLSGSKDANLLDFLMDAGFSNLRSDDYDKDPSRYTVSTVMGHQKIGEGDDAFELIAVGVCGQGYMDEWESNFSIGTSYTHDGFRRSSLLVYDRIFGYIARNNLQGPLKIWISGFSRAAAISNITAAWLSDSGVFSQDTVFAYTFGTPNTTMNPDLPVYSNIYNICGKTDPVTMIPFADWGYKRYGTTLYTPAPESDSDFSIRRVKADKIYKDLTGIDFWINTDMNDDLRVMMDYLLRVCPNIDIYAGSLQDHLISLWEKHDPISVLKHLLVLAEDPVLFNDENRHDANMFLNSVAGLSLDYFRSDNSFRRWNNQASAAANLLQSHTPELYMSWAFSGDTADEVFSTSSDYSEVYINGDVTVAVYRDNSYIEELETGDLEGAEECHHLRLRNNGQMSCLIPRDRNYVLEIYSNRDQTLDMLEVNLSHGRHSPDETSTDHFELLNGDTMYVGYAPTGNTIYSREENYSTTGQYNSNEYLNDEGLYRYASSRFSTDYNWRDVVLAVIAVIIMLVMLAVFLVAVLVIWLRFRRRRKRGLIPQDVRFRPLPIFCTFLILEVFFIEEFQNALYDDASSNVLIYKTIIGLLTLVIAYYGYRRKRDQMHLLVIGAVALLMMADITMVGSIISGAALHIAAYTLLTYIFIHKDYPDRGQALVWIIFSLVGIYAVTQVPGQFGIARVLAVLYIPAVLGMTVTSFHLSPRLFRGSFLLMIAGILLINNQVRGTTFFSHIISLGIYYIAVVTLASSGSLFMKPKMIPVPIVEEPVK